MAPFVEALNGTSCSTLTPSNLLLFKSSSKTTWLSLFPCPCTPSPASRSRSTSSSHLRRQPGQRFFHVLAPLHQPQGQGQPHLEAPLATYSSGSHKSPRSPHKTQAAA